MLPLALLLVGSVLASTVSNGDAAPGADSAFAVTVLAVVASALVSGLSVWLTDSTSRLLLMSSGAACAAGTTYLLLGQLGIGPLLGASLALVAGGLWGRWVVSVFALAHPTRAALIEVIPERDRVVPLRPEDALSCTTTMGDPWSVDVGSVRMQRLVTYGIVVFGAIVALSWDSAPMWWVAVLGACGVTFCLAMAAWASVRVQIDQGGLSVTSLRVPVQLVRVRAEDVLGVASVEVDPMVWGGWGLRWNARHTAYISSGGPGLIVYRSSGRPLAIEIPEGTSMANDGAKRLRQIAGRAQTR